MKLKDFEGVKCVGGAQLVAFDYDTFNEEDSLPNTKRSGTKRAWIYEWVEKYPEYDVLFFELDMFEDENHEKHPCAVLTVKKGE